jgi:hypothetical protein
MSKTPKTVNDVLHPKFGIALVLAQSGVVVSAFGKPMGFVIMMTAVVGSAALGVGMLYVVGRSLMRILALA